jgi:hypothetical protein
MIALNKLIEADANLGKGYRIGHSFFTPSEKQSYGENWFLEIIEHEICPLIQEYWSDEDDKIREAMDIVKPGK